MLKKNADEYKDDCVESLKRNGHMNDVSSKQADKIPQEVIEAILVDFINLVGMKQCVDYGLYTKDLVSEEV